MKLSNDVLGKYFRNFDIVLLQETWAKSTSVFNIDGYKYFNFARMLKNEKSKRSSGGLGIFVRKFLLEGLSIVKTFYDYIVWFKLGTNVTLLDKPLYVAVVYFPPQGSVYSTEHDLYGILLQNVQMYLQDGYVIICGDYNARTGKLTDIAISYCGKDIPNHDSISNFNIDTYKDTNVSKYDIERVNKDICVNLYGRELVEMCKAIDLVILHGRFDTDRAVGKYTRNDSTGKSVVDYVISHKSSINIIGNFRIEDKMPESDHVPLNFSIVKGHNKVSGPYNKNSIGCKVTEIMPVHSKQYKWSREKLPLLMVTARDEISRTAMSTFRECLTKLEDVNVTADALLAFIVQAADRTFEVKNDRYFKNNSDLNKFSPWFDKECREARKAAIADGRGDPYDPDKALQSCKAYRSIKQRKKRQYRRDVYARLEHNCNNNNKAYLWNLLRPYRSIPRSNLFSLEEFYNAFMEQASPNHDIEWDAIYEDSILSFLTKYENGSLDGLCQNSIMLDIINDNFTREELSNVISTLKVNKSAGYDGIPPEFYKTLTDVLVDDIALLLNYVIEKRIAPDSWAIGMKVPVPKLKKPESVTDFRQITILPVISKIFEVAVLKRFSFVNESFNLVDQNNGGFLQGSSTIDNMLILLGSIQSQLAKRSNLFVCFVDFSRAFDLINRGILFYKLIKSGFHGRVVDTLRNMYTKTKARVKVGAKLSPFICNEMGVNQVGILSPFLFRKYLNDMKDYFNEEDGIKIESKFLMYLLWADDMILMSETANGLQRQINRLSDYCLKNQLIVNTLKTKVVVFGTINKDVNFTFNSSSIDIEDDYKYLGVLFSRCIKVTSNPFKNNMSFLTDKANKAAQAIFGYSAYLGKFQFTPVSLYLIV